MRIILLTIGLILTLTGAFVFYNKLYYPSLPIETLSKKEVIEKLNNSDETIIKLTNENEKVWFIVNERNQSVVDEVIIDLMSQKEWVFKGKDGSGLFFEKLDDDLMITTQKWTRNYSLVDIPVKFDE